MAEIRFTIPDDKVETAMKCFVADQPIPTDIDGKPKYTPAQWWKQWVILRTKQAIQKGKNKLEVVTVDKDIIS